MNMLPVNEFLSAAQGNLMLDVRSGSEFHKGHIPGAISLPLFSDAERAEVGTLYKRQGKQQAFLRGLDFASAKMRSMTETALDLSQGRPIYVYCWRGGMRSGSVAWLLRMAGLQVNTLQKGYKNFRNFVLQQFSTQRSIKILGGKTGAGKTEFLRRMHESHYTQAIDLEELAQHKGSAFGGLGQNEQPTQETFENELGFLLSKTDPQKDLWLEDESRLIGRITIPEPLWAQMRKAPVYLLQTDIEKRVDRLTSEYGAFSKEELKRIILKISKRLGGQRTKDALLAIDEGNVKGAVRISLDYYDRSYAFGLAKRDASTISDYHEINSEEPKAGQT